MPKGKTYFRSMGTWEPAQKRHKLNAKYNDTSNTRSTAHGVIETADNTMSNDESYLRNMQPQVINVI